MLWLLLCVALVPGRARSAAAPLDPGVPPLHPVVATDGRVPAVQQGCNELGQANECFNALSGAYLNVGAFFDANRSSSAAHFFLKLFRNDTADSLHLTGMGFYARTSSAQSRVFQAAGAIVMGKDLVFPREDALLNLNTVGIVAAADTEMTCVPFEEAIDTKGRRARPVLGPGDAAWIALRFPDLAEDVVLEIEVDSDATDLDCDFLTPDTGKHWYRPDPRSTPHYDWGITVFTDATVSRPEPVTPTWSLVKAMYR